MSHSFYILRDPETNPLDDLLAELRDSTLFPLLLNPFQVVISLIMVKYNFVTTFQITKLTCGSLITFYDTGATDATVAVDVCLTALIVAKVSIACTSS